MGRKYYKTNNRKTANKQRNKVNSNKANIKQASSESLQKSKTDITHSSENMVKSNLVAGSSLTNQIPSQTTVNKKKTHKKKKNSSQLKINNAQRQVSTTDNLKRNPSNQKKIKISKNKHPKTFNGRKNREMKKSSVKILARTLRKLSKSNVSVQGHHKKLNEVLKHIKSELGVKSETILPTEKGSTTRAKAVKSLITYRNRAPCLGFKQDPSVSTHRTRTSVKPELLSEKSSSSLSSVGDKLDSTIKKFVKLRFKKSTINLLAVYPKTKSIRFKTLQQKSIDHFRSPVKTPTDVVFKSPINISAFSTPESESWATAESSISKPSLKSAEDLSDKSKKFSFKNFVLKNESLKSNTNLSLDNLPTNLFPCKSDQALTLLNDAEAMNELYHEKSIKTDKKSSKRIALQTESLRLIKKCNAIKLLENDDSIIKSLENMVNHEKSMKNVHCDEIQKSNIEEASKLCANSDETFLSTKESTKSVKNIDMSSLSSESSIKSTYIISKTDLPPEFGTECMDETSMKSSTKIYDSCELILLKEKKKEEEEAKKGSSESFKTIKLPDNSETSLESVKSEIMAKEDAKTNEWEDNYLANIEFEITVQTPKSKAPAVKVKPLPIFEIVEKNVKITHARATRCNAANRQNVENSKNVEFFYDYVVALNPKQGCKVTSELPGPVFKFRNDLKWRQAGDIVKRAAKLYGIYFAGIRWREIQPINPTIVSEQTTVLHVFNNEPENRYKGRLGPVNLYIPHVDFASCKVVNGLWTSVFNDYNPPNQLGTATVFDSEYIRKLRENHPDMNQALFYVTNNAALVGMLIMHSAEEERSFRILTKNNFHHERPLILSGGYYLVDGIFHTKFYNPEKNRTLVEAMSNTLKSKVILLCEGKHMIRVATEYDGKKPGSSEEFQDARTSPRLSKSSSNEQWHDAETSSMDEYKDAKTYIKKSNISFAKRRQRNRQTGNVKEANNEPSDNNNNKRTNRKKFKKKTMKRDIEKLKTIANEMRDYTKIRRVEVQMDAACTDIVMIDAKELLQDLGQLNL